MWCECLNGAYPLITSIVQLNVVLDAITVQGWLAMHRSESTETRSTYESRVIVIRFKNYKWTICLSAFGYKRSRFAYAKIPINCRSDSLTMRQASQPSDLSLTRWWRHVAIIYSPSNNNAISLLKGVFGVWCWIMALFVDSASHMT
jgi:hypothetical protein